MGFRFGVARMFWNSIEVVVVHRECAKLHRILHFKTVHFVLFEFHKLNLDERSRKRTDWSLKISL